MGTEWSEVFTKGNELRLRNEGITGYTTGVGETASIFDIPQTVQIVEVSSDTARDGDWPDEITLRGESNEEKVGYQGT